MNKYEMQEFNVWINDTQLRCLAHANNLLILQFKRPGTILYSETVTMLNDNPDSCTHCGHIQRHTFKFPNETIPLYFYCEDYDFDAWCSKCHRQFTAVYRPETIQEELKL